MQGLKQREKNGKDEIAEVERLFHDQLQQIQILRLAKDDFLGNGPVHNSCLALTAETRKLKGRQTFAIRFVMTSLHKYT